MAEQFDFQPLIQAVVDGEGEDAVSLVEQALMEGFTPNQIIDSGLVEGMKIVSDKYDRKQYFVPDLAASAEAMSDALKTLMPFLLTQADKSKGVIVIGVVKECSQEIGKNIVSATLSAAGFMVHDLGINVAPRQFVDKAKETNANIIAMGSPMLQTLKYFGETVELLKSEGMRDRVKVLVGGAATNEKTPEAFGADAWGRNHAEAVTAAEKLMGLAGGN